jgi:hypothetical protein
MPPATTSIPIKSEPQTQEAPKDPAASRNHQVDCSIVRGLSEYDSEATCVRFSSQLITVNALPPEFVAMLTSLHYSINKNKVDKVRTNNQTLKNHQRFPVAWN